jgi:hypothetical protein
MTNQDQGKSFDESSPSVQAHLGIIQATIQRMASNSSASKSWCITVVSAILVIVADKGKPDFALISLIPTTLFGALDVYYLALEKGFRESYSSFVKNLYDGTLKPSDFYTVSPKGSIFKHRIDAIKSFSIWGFYLTLILLIMIARNLVIR